MPAAKIGIAASVAGRCNLRLFASLYFGSGWAEFYWAFSFYLVLLNLY
jgi:hypothetical protein